MEQPNGNFIDTLQRLDEPMKRRVLVIATMITMIAVVYLWMGYFKNITMNNQGQFANESAVTDSAAAAPQAPASNPPSTAPDFWSMLGSSFTSFYHAVRSPRQYDIMPAHSQ